MSFFEDVVFIMRNQTMFISDRHDNSLTELEIPEKLGHNKLVSFIHVNNKIYVYEDRSSGVIQKLFNDRWVKLSRYVFSQYFKFFLWIISTNINYNLYVLGFWI